MYTNTLVPDMFYCVFYYIIMKFKITQIIVEDVTIL